MPLFNLLFGSLVDFHPCLWSRHNCSVPPPIRVTSPPLLPVVDPGLTGAAAWDDGILGEWFCGKSLAGWWFNNPSEYEPNWKSSPIFGVKIENKN